MKRFFYLPLALVTLGFVACTSAPELEDYPERQIDRPYTLPEGVASWTTTVATRVIDNGSDTGTISINPLNFEQALSENWTLEYAPIPLGLRYQITNTEKHILGASLRTGIGYSSFSGVLLAPSAGLYHRYRFASSYAWESRLSYYREINARATEDQEDQTILMTGPMFQLSDRFVLSPKLGAGIVRNELARFDGFGNSIIDDDGAFIMPLVINFRWLFHRQWEYGATYDVNSIVLEEDRLAIHQLNMFLIHFW